MKNWFDGAVPVHFIISSNVTRKITECYPVKHQKFVKNVIYSSGIRKITECYPVKHQKFVKNVIYSSGIISHN